MGIDTYVFIELNKGAKARLNACLKRAGRAPPRWLGPRAAAVSTGLRYGEPVAAELRAALVHDFGEELFALHADQRGLFACSDLAAEAAFDAEDYEDALERLEGAGVWLPLEPGGVAAAPKAPSFDDLLTNLWVDDPDEELCLLLRPSARIDSSDLEAHDVSLLRDGSRVVHTTTAGESAYRSMRQRLQRREAALLETHADPRGVLSFRDGLLEEVRESTDYAGAVARVGKRGRWLCRRGERPVAPRQDDG